MKLDILLFLEDNLNDENLLFMGRFIPDELTNSLSSIDLFNNIYYSVSENYNGKLKSLDNTFIRSEGDNTAFWKDLFGKTESNHIIKIFCDSSFLDITLIEEMANLHIDSLAEFTFSENLPSGFGCEIVSKDLIDALPEIDKKSLPLGAVVKSNINHFDVEIYYKDPDLRDKRVSFRNGNKRDSIIMENLFKLNNKVPTYIDIKDLIDNNPNVLYISPSYIEIELTGKCELNCVFCYRNDLAEEHGDMSLDLYKNILSQMSSFGLPYSISLGGSGEPMMHPHFYEILEFAVKEDLIEQIVVETNGIYADNTYKEFISDKQNSKIKIIININGLDISSYKSIHGNDFFEKVENNINQLKEIENFKERVYLQVMKINETEKFLDQYYNFWEKTEIPIILQKQNTFLGKIEDRRYSDLSPMERTPCWHLQRDLNILSDGTVGFCKMDIDGSNAIGNLNYNTLKEIFLTRKESFENDYSKKYSLKPDCRSCDEWYTFNL